MTNFVLLKRTYPISYIVRECDGYDYIKNNISKEQQIYLNINLNKIKKKINKGEKYMYQVGKEKGKFKVMCISLENFELIRKSFFGDKDE